MRSWVQMSVPQKKKKVKMGARHQPGYTCNPRYLGSWDQDDQCLRPDQANSSQDPISKITRAKWARVVAQVSGHRLTSTKLNSNPGFTKKKKKKGHFHVMQISPWLLKS
jgi:hypothetical protein